MTCSFGTVATKGDVPPLARTRTIFKNHLMSVTIKGAVFPKILQKWQYFSMGFREYHVTSVGIQCYETMKWFFTRPKFYPKPYNLNPTLVLPEGALSGEIPAKVYKYM